MRDNGHNIESKVISGLFWSFAEKMGARGVEFIVSVVLARLLLPRDYGLIAMVTIFITISQVFVDSGLGNALVQKKNADNIDFSTVFYFNVILCLIVYIVLFLISPFIAVFYGKPELSSVLRVLGVTVIISSLKNVQQAYVSKNMLFKRFFFSTLGGTITAAIVGIVLAYRGYGIWALVAQQLTNLFIDTLILWITVKWRPIFAFSLERLKVLYSFGWKMLVASLVDTFFGNIRQLVIGKLYTSADLAYYNRGSQFPNFIVSNINSAIDSVLLPAMSAEQDYVSNVKNMTRRAIKTSCYIMWPMMMGLFVIADGLIKFLLTDKWLPAIPFLRIYCIVLAFEPIHTANLNAIKAMGRSDIILKLEVTKKITALCILLVAMRFGVLAIALSTLLYSFIAQILNSFPNRSLLQYNYFEQLKDIMPSVVLSLIMMVIVYPIHYLSTNYVMVMFIQIFGGIFIYIIGSFVCKLEAFEYIKKLLSKVIRKGTLK